MARWIKVCSLEHVPQAGSAIEASAGGVEVCLANVQGELAAVDNRCPHRGGPLGQGCVEGRSIVCPWHAWAFDLKSGNAQSPVHHRIAVFPVRIQGDDVQVELDQGGT